MSKHDPTADEMRAFLIARHDPDDVCNFDIEEAIYWYAHDYHGGQWSNLYSALSTSPFTPGAYSTGLPDDSVSLDMYTELTEEYGS